MLTNKINVETEQKLQWNCFDPSICKMNTKFEARFPLIIHAKTINEIDEVVDHEPNKDCWSRNFPDTPSPSYQEAKKTVIFVGHGHLIYLKNVCEI